MHILVFTDRFLPEITAPSFREMQHAVEWIRAGHEVTVVTCAPNFPHGKVFPGYRNRCYQVEWMDGVRVVRIWSYMTANEGTIKRTLDYLSFVLSAIFFFWRYPKFDVILATSPPLFVPIAGHVVSRLRRRPWVFEIRDLWPATIEAVGAGKGRMLKLLTRLEMFLYRKANHLIPLTDSFRENLVGRGIPVEKIDVVTNGVDTDRFCPGNVRFDARKELGVGPDKFLAGYVGTVGMCHGLETLLDAAERCRENPDVVLLVMGEGAERPGLEAEARRRNLDNVIFHDFVPQEEVVSYVGALDATIVHLRPHPVFKTVIPSKIFENMAMGVPMVYAVEGHSAGIVERVGAGICIPSGDPKAMADALLQLAHDPEKREQLSQAGRDAAAREFSRRAKAGEMIHAMEKTLVRAGRPGLATTSSAAGESPTAGTRGEERS
jgi:colanic acid biosynthesis glycosyl transferase WcaI